jgi:hypothetical protein
MAAAAATGLCLLAGPVLAQFPPVTDPNKDEAKCQKGTGSALVKFTGAKTKCISKCISTQRKAAVPAYGGCFGPGFTDPTTQACINDPVKGAEPKARAAIVKACAKDCPECYTARGPVCTTGEPDVTDTESQIDPFGNLIYCTEAFATTPTKTEAKCEDTVVKSLVKFVGGKVKCYQKCQGNLLKGKIAPGSCDPPASDPATQACVAKAETKAETGIDKVCEVVGSKPACYGAVGAPIMGAGWVSLVESNIDFRTPITNCGSPSGAFLE